MKALLIADEDNRTETFGAVFEILNEALRQRGIGAETFWVNKRNVTFCRGCYDCWIKTPGQCAIRDSVGSLNGKTVQSDIVVYLGPVVFGQFGTNIKNVLERSLPNLLPFLVTRANGASSHPYRYEKCPRRVYIGYGDDISGEEKQNFTAILHNHQENVQALIYAGADDGAGLRAQFEAILENEVRQ